MQKLKAKNAFNLLEINKNNNNNGNADEIDDSDDDASVTNGNNDIEESDITDSDEELQRAFANKQLKPGLNIQLDAPKTHVNNVEALKRKYDDVYLKMDWVERLDVTVDKNNLGEENENELADNDFKREHSFFLQAQSAVLEGIAKLKRLGVFTERPDDYFAEMAKTDDHMKKVKEALLSKHAELERRDKVRKLRELKKIGKQVQIEAQKKKHKEKRKLNDTVKKIKKGDKDGFDILAEELGEKKERKDKKEKPKNVIGAKVEKKVSKKRKFKDDKFGFGGKKKRSKQNTAESTSDIISNKKRKFNGKIGKINNRNGKVNKKFLNKNKPKRNRK